MDFQFVTTDKTFTYYVNPDIKDQPANHCSGLTEVIKFVFKDEERIITIYYLEK